MFRKVALLIAVITGLALLPVTAAADTDHHGQFSPGAPAVGDPYFPLDETAGTTSRTTASD